MALIEFRGLACDDVDGIFMEVTKGFLMPPAVRGGDYTVAALAGRMSGNRIADVSALLLEGYVAGDTPEEWRANDDDWKDVLAEGGLEPGLLVVRAPLFGLAPGESASISARVVNAVEGPIVAYSSQTWSVALESVDPAWVRASGGS